MGRSQTSLYYALAFVVCFVWGATFVSTKILLNAGLSPEMVFFLRFLLAYVAMLPLSHRRMWCDSWRDEALMMLVGISGGSLFFYAENTSLLYTQSANVSFLTALPPLVLVVGRALMPGGKRGGWNVWTGAALAVAGLYCFVVGADPEAAPRPLLGNVIALLSTFLWCIYQVLANPLSERYGTRFVTRKMFGYGVLTILPFVAGDLGDVTAKLVTVEQWVHLFFLGMVASWFCYFAWNIVMERLGSVTSSNFLYLNPFVTCLASYALLGEKLTPYMMLGGLFTIAGVYLSLKKPAELRMS